MEIRVIDSSGQVIDREVVSATAPEIRTIEVYHVFSHEDYPREVDDSGRILLNARVEKPGALDAANDFLRREIAETQRRRKAADLIDTQRTADYIGVPSMNVNVQENTNVTIGPI